jgi:predicted phosphohydrolase
MPPTPSLESVEKALSELIAHRARWRLKELGPRWPSSAEDERAYQREHTQLRKALDAELQAYIDAEVERLTD